MARNATAVVLDVMNIVLAARRIVYAIRRLWSFYIPLYSPLWFHASKKMKKSSAAIPSIMKMAKLFRMLK